MEQPKPGEITLLLKRLSAGDRDAESNLMELIYDHMHRMARLRLQVERPDITLRPSDIVSELYLRLIRDTSIEWRNGAHLFALMARTIRNILVDHARRYAGGKRPPPASRVSLEDVFVYTEDRSAFLLELNDVLNRLAQEDPRAAHIVEMRLFGGLSEQEIAAALDLAERTVRRDWQFARSWLQAQLNRDLHASEAGA